MFANYIYMDRDIYICSLIYIPYIESYGVCTVAVNVGGVPSHESIHARIYVAV